MTLFTKKLNIREDKLIRRFNASKRCYYYETIIDGKKVIVQLKDLDRESKHVLLWNNRKLSSDNELFQQELKKYNREKRTIFLKNAGVPCTSLEYMGIPQGIIEPEVSNILNNLVNNTNSLLGVCLLSEEFDEENLCDIFCLGINLGNITSPQALIARFKNVVSYFANNEAIIKELLYVKEYHKSTGAILIQISDDNLIKNEDIFYEIDGEIRINPKYIIGFLPLSQNRHLESIILRTQYLNQISVGTR